MQATTTENRFCHATYLMKTKLIVIGLVSAFAFVLVAQQRNAQGRQPESAGADAAIVSKLSEIVSIRERAAKNYESMLAAGRAQADGSAEIELAEARIELARERGERDAVITELKGLVAAHERRAKRMMGLAADRVASGDADRAQVAYLESQVRLLRAQK